MEKDIGALWIKKGKQQAFMSGSIEVNGQKADIVIFRNERKTKDNQPDYRVFLKRPKVVSQETRMGNFPETMTEQDIPF